VDGLARDAGGGRHGRRIRIVPIAEVSYNTRVMTTTAAPAPADLVADACRLIERTDDRVPTVAELAAELDVSPDGLRRAIGRVLGVTPRQ
jgi:AraC-like DNA-binding protein